ncbi:MAG: hypothetical protein ACJARP_003286 [Vicingaceae bacterium]
MIWIYELLKLLLNEKTSVLVTKRSYSDMRYKRNTFTQMLCPIKKSTAQIAHLQFAQANP